MNYCKKLKNPEYHLHFLYKIDCCDFGEKNLLSDFSKPPCFSCVFANIQICILIPLLL